MHFTICNIDGDDAFECPLVKKQVAGTLSGGEQQMLAMGSTMSMTRESYVKSVT